MAELDLHALRNKLLKLQEELSAIADSSEQSSAVVELDQSRVGRLTRMDALQAQAMAKASKARRADMQRKIAVALKRIERDEYGVCKACDEPINPKRLDFDPTADLCIDCASDVT